MHLAWFSPLPPVRSGIAVYSAELLPLLAADYAIDVFVEDPNPANVPNLSVRSAHDFLWRHAGAPYDLVVYQLGNSSCHDFMWPYLVRHPGLVVLHDAHLHHARAMALLGRGRREDYRAEIVANHPDARPAIADFAFAGLQGPHYYLWAMRRIVLQTARRVAVHSRLLAAELRDEVPDTPVDVLRMGVREPRADAETRAGGLRRRLGLEPDDVVFAALGAVTPEKRISQAIGALAALPTAAVRSVLMLVGETVSYYDAKAEAERLGVADRVLITGYVDEAALDDYLAVADVCLCLRWPTARETSAAWLRCLAAGRATVVTDLAHTVDTPSLDPRTWTLLEGSESADALTHTGADAICVSIDILDEDHSLRLAMRRLATDAALRREFGRRGRASWAARHAPELMAADYRTAIDAARATAPRRVTLPPHLVDDGSATMRRVLAEFGADGFLDFATSGE
jgi:glycosyltransferase involved in cell wall biosynthesis